MPPWVDYKRASQERGSLALELYVVVSTPARPPEEVRAALPDHLAYQAEQEKAGALVLAGPLSDLTGAEMQAEGLIVYRAPSLEAARAIAEADPMHGTGARTFTIRRWLVNEGSLNLSVGLSTGRVSLT